MSIPLDSDGFLRRECPTCEREFKWLPNTSDEGDTDSVRGGGYFCPYCGVQAPPTAWFTKAQITLAESIVEAEIVGPILENFARNIEGIGRRSGGLIATTAEYDEPEKVDPLTDTDDMQRVDFDCHPSEPVKVSDDWRRPVRCLICGVPSS
jgi:hypothetical protein